MTYTFKLARRLAVSRTFGMLPAILLVAACGGSDANTSPLGPQDDWRPREAIPVAVSVNPSKVTVETNQLIRFLAYGRNSSGDSVYAPITWHTTGGIILHDGRFSSAAVGTFMVTGATPDGIEDRIDTAVVVVVRRQPFLHTIEIAPGSATLAPGVSQTFLVTGRLKDGRAVPVGVSWSAAGGSIDAGGNYVAGDTAGTYQVVATNLAMTVADTATVTITAPPPPPPPPAPAPPEEPPTSAVAKLILMPASATLAPSTNRQFSAFGRTAAGDSVSVSVVFAATGGTVTSTGLYTAGGTAGSYRVIANAGGLADTSTITVTQPMGSGPATGIALGAFHVPTDSLNGSLSYNGTVITATSTRLLSDLNTVRAHNGRVVLAVGRSKLKDANGLSVAAARAELASWPDIGSYIADGTIIGIYVSDDILSTEWGPNPPYLSRIDSVAREVKVRWPNAITMVRAKPTELSGRSQWLWLETAWAQYRGPYRDPPPKQFADREVISAKAQKLGLVIWMNALDGGCGPTTACLPGVPGTSIEGTFTNATSVRRFQVSAAEVLNYGTAFLAEPYNCAALAWQYSPVYNRTSLPADQLAGIQAFDKRSDVRAAMAQLRTLAQQRTNTSCRQR